MRQTCIFSGSSHPKLVGAICERLGQKPSQVSLKKFSNGETSVEIKTSVRDQDVFVVQSGSSEINDNVVELLIMIHACKGGSSRSITAVVPYFPYSRQSKKKTHRGAITARMLANLMRVAGVDHVITIDLHATQMQGFFKCPVDNLRAEPLIGKWVRQNIPDWQEAVVVSKNPGGTKRVTSLADALGLSFGVVTTERYKPHIPTSMMNSVILERIGTDGTNEHEMLREEIELDEALQPERQTVHQDFAHDSRYYPHTTNGEQPANRQLYTRTTSTMSNQVRSRMINSNSDYASSPLANSTRAASIVPEEEGEDAPISSPQIAPTRPEPHHDEDGYEDSEGEPDKDESAQDVITGRLVQGHIVDDDAPSPGQISLSSSSRSAQGNGSKRSPSDDEPPDTMTQSFLSTTSNRRVHGLGGTGDAQDSDGEEEEALQNPELETTVTLVGNVRDRPVLIVDDMIDKAGSWIAAAETVVKRGGARKVYCMATHGLFGGDALRELEECEEIEAVVVTNAFPIPEGKRAGCSKLCVLDVSGLLAEAIRRNHHGESISQLYQHFD